MVRACRYMMSVLAPLIASIFGFVGIERYETYPPHIVRSYLRICHLHLHQDSKYKAADLRGTVHDGCFTLLRKSP